jgi:hypothetical protein
MVGKILKSLLSIFPHSSKTRDVLRCYICGSSYKLPDARVIENFRETKICNVCGGSMRYNDVARILLRVINTKASYLAAAEKDLKESKIYMLESYGPIHDI